MRAGTCWHLQYRQRQSGCSWYARRHGIDQAIKGNADALEAAGQVDGSFQITSGKLLDAVLGGAITDQAREELQAVIVLQDLFGAPG